MPRDRFGSGKVAAAVLLGLLGLPLGCSTSGAQDDGPGDAGTGTTGDAGSVSAAGDASAPPLPTDNRADGQACTAAPECTSSVCTAGLCAHAAPNDGVMNGGETDVDCGGVGSAVTDGAMACGDGLHCLLATDCTSHVCTGGTCAVPSCTDTVKNGAETDVDCGGGVCPACAVTKGCLVAGDCSTSACNYDHACVSAPSCVAHNGGDTCGAGETGDPAAQHEDCCVALEVPRPAASGGPFLLDKYLITAGRMRAFLEAVDYDVQTYIKTSAPAWWPTGTTATTWNAMLPTSHDDFIYLTSSDDASGCVVGSAKGAVGAPAMWEDAADLAAAVSGAPRTFTQAVMDQKVMNCFRAPLFHALCAYDGGRMPSRAEWIAARTTWGGANGTTATVMTLPWASDGAAYGSTADKQAHGVYDSLAGTSYIWPSAPTDNDFGSYLAAPGRFPLGYGPYGHADLEGSVENMGSQPVSATSATIEGDGWFQDSFQETEVHAYSEQYVGFGDGTYRPHWAVGGRCVKLP